jgi:hemolysin activation/secretion protein
VVGDRLGGGHPFDERGLRKRPGCRAVARDAEHAGAAVTSPAGLTPPQNASNLSVAISNVTVEGGFPELEAETAAIAAKIRGRRVTVAEIFAAANAIEQAYAAHGYVLVRIAVPPQQLKSGGQLRLVVIDGFVESLDVKGVPEKQRALVQARLASLIGRRHVTLPEIERRLILASDVPGLVLSSTIARGGRARWDPPCVGGDLEPRLGDVGSRQQAAEITRKLGAERVRGGEQPVRIRRAVLRRSVH